LFRRKKTIEVKILDVEPAPLGSYVKFELPNGQKLTTFALCNQSIKEAVKQKLDMLIIGKKWKEKGAEKHLKYKGKKVKIKI